MIEQVCVAKQELAQDFFADDHRGTVTVSSHTISFDMSHDPTTQVWWRISDVEFTSLMAYRGSYGRGPKSGGLGDVMIHLQEGPYTFEGRLGELQLASVGQFSIRQIA